MPRGIGDSVFVRSGVPGVVTERDPSGVRVVIEQKGPNIDDVRKRGYINGLSQTERTEFNEAIDRVRAIADPKQRVVELRSMIDEMKADPRKQMVTRYLESELVHTMISYKIAGREYITDDERIR